MRLDFYTLDVFTDRALAGNPLAVVLGADDLANDRMQAIAREFALSETVFVCEPNDPINTARLRIFTPTRELPFAGHPTVGAAVLLGELRAPEMLVRQDVRVVLEEAVGDVVCEVGHPRGKAARARFVLPRLPERVADPAPAEAIAQALNLAVEDIGFDRHELSVFSAGNGFTFVPLRSREAIAQAHPNTAHWRAAMAAPDHTGLFLYTRECETTGNAFHARMFAPLSGVVEDPATGSAVAAFAGIVMAFEQPADGHHVMTIEQGFEMGRPSLIGLGLEVENGRLTEATISGSAVIVQRGTFTL